MSLKHFAILVKFIGLAMILVPLFFKSMGDFEGLSQTWIITMIVIGAVFLLSGNVMEARARRGRDHW